MCFKFQWTAKSQAWTSVKDKGARALLIFTRYSQGWMQGKTSEKASSYGEGLGKGRSCQEEKHKTPLRTAPLRNKSLKLLEEDLKSYCPKTQMVRMKMEERWKENPSIPGGGAENHPGSILSVQAILHLVPLAGIAGCSTVLFSISGRKAFNGIAVLSGPRWLLVCSWGF